MVEKKQENDPIFDRQLRIPGWKQSVISSQVFINTPYSIGLLSIGRWWIRMHSC